MAKNEKTPAPVAPVAPTPPTAPAAPAAPTPPAAPVAGDAPTPPVAGDAPTPPVAGDAPTPPAAPVAKGGRKAGTVNVPPVLTVISAAVPMPAAAVKSKRGAKSAYPFDDLTEIGMSFGIKNKTGKNLSSTVSMRNKAMLVEKKDGAGNVVFKTIEKKDEAGNVTVETTTEPEMIATAHYTMLEVDPATDPDGAAVRIWRDA